MGLVSFEKRGLKAVVRASLHYFNTDEEIDIFVDSDHDFFCVPCIEKSTSIQDPTLRQKCRL